MERTRIIDQASHVARFSIAGCASGLLAVAMLACGPDDQGARRTVRVGVYDNPPKVELASAGRARGIFVDVIEEVARRAGWRLEYVHGTWAEGLDRLEDGRIDIMPDVALSDARSERFDFNRIPVLHSWIQVFGRKGHAIKSIYDLEGKRVAVLEGSIQEDACDELKERFGLEFAQVPMPDYEGTLRLIESGEADAAILSRFFGYRQERTDALVPTSAILLPTTLHFATAKGRNRDLLDEIDGDLAGMMDDPRSAYYRSLAAWLSEKPRTFVPRPVVWTIAASAVAALFFLSLSIALRWQVRRRTDELREKNRELLAALERLEAAQDEAIRRERLYAMGQMASGIAHDFNNLLWPIMSYADLLLASPDKLDDRRFVSESLEGIRAAARHGAELVQRMQSFQRTARHPGAAGRIEVDALVREVVDMAMARWRGREPGAKATVEVSLDLGGDSTITGNRSEIHEMLLNLVLNAADAMPDGGRVRVSTVRGTDGLAIKVEDSGAGMTEEVREKCLEPFFTTKGEKGTGMGLTMVHRTVLDLGGRIEISSAPGMGTSVVITLPLGDA